MSKDIGVLVCLSIMVLDISAGVIGIEAEIAQNKVKHPTQLVVECTIPSFKAFKLGLAATILLGLAHVIANVLGGCICIGSKADLPTANRQLAISSLIFSWIILAIGLTMLIIGTLANSKSRKYCATPHHRLFTIGGILCFIHGLFAVAYYVSAKATAKEERQNRRGSQA
ncbi:hypothetical protein SLEP1_g29508 [Rubroshorea leprosula]|uniref:Uncharacterized protein n=1 Tax=Rubroshorea leprosula TaxID=152421 RepID=A0AAV5K464_9ROSI|nr:hypothetical protein SLEP1_g29508 [Rubroshorea leprosula]